MAAVDLFERYRSALVSQPISIVWRGHGSALFLELGQLSPTTRRDGTPGIGSGEYAVMIEWSWRIEDENAILCGSWSDEEEWEMFFQSLVGHSVEDISLSGRLPELSVSISGNRYVSSFMTCDGQPAWAILDRNAGRTLHVEDGRICEEFHSRRAT